jgi:hemolysin III
MGWIVVFAFGKLKAQLPPQALFFLFAGGLLYTVGAGVYALKKLPWSHPLWHLFVLGGAACHVVAALKALG